MVRLLPAKPLNADMVAARAPMFPLVAELLAQPLAGLLSGKPVVERRAPHLLRLLAGRGSTTHDLLTAIEGAIRLFDRQAPRGWLAVRSSMARASRDKLLSVCGELVIARWLVTEGVELLEMEPEND